MILEDAQGVPITVRHEQALTAYKRASSLFLQYRRDPLVALGEALALDPDLIMAYCLRAVLFMLSTDAASSDQVAGALNEAEARAHLATERERHHMAAARAWLEGDWEAAASHWETILLEFPRDILALQSAHLADFFLGATGRLRDRVARVLPFWNDSVPGYGFVLGMYAFGLEENADYERAEEMGCKALSYNSHDAWAVHAVAHVMEMQGRFRAGIEWLRERQNDWSSQDYMACHNWWHLALFYFELEDVDNVLDIYDQAIRAEGSEVITDLIDASSLLWRLMLEGVDVGERWQEIAEKWERAALDAHYAFNDCHAMMALAKTGRDDLCDDMLAALERRAGEERGSNAAMTREIGLTVCRAVRAFAADDYGTVIDLLQPVRYRFHRFGGSHAQRDVLDLTLLAAALRSPSHQKLAHALTAERCALKPESPHNWRLAFKALSALGRNQAAQEAADRARRLAAP
ncbi:MAG: tetratricopeptide repeat protein [Acidobacteriota bacterium]|nr:tetratricopeptide repeat protein [Acidobacteriota bacterium]